ncbi:MAG: sugar O-acetyltransferase [Bacillota bacterium]|nr:sugar O-acetyltransferase [Bacillota bacterium]
MKQFKDLMNGHIYLCPDNDQRFAQGRGERKDIIFEYNHTKPSELKFDPLRPIFESCGENVYIEPPFYANCGGMFTSIGNNVYANFGLTLVDDGPITIGNNVLFGPHVMITTTGHPVDPDIRKATYQFSEPVVIEDNVWVGGDVVILPGVTIGENSIIGAHSTVTKDIPANCIALGNPCRVVREINEKDKEY